MKQSQPTFTAPAGYALWLQTLRCLAYESGVKHLVPKEDSKMLGAFESDWSPEMALDDLTLQSQFGDNYK